MVKIFISYSHADEALRQELDKHLMALKRQNLIDVWHDRRISAGDEWADKIDANLRAADLVLLLVSPDFIASPYCYEKEMQDALRRHDEGAAVVIPVILRPCEWQELPFGRLQAATRDGRPVTKYGNVDDAFLEITRAIKSAIANVEPRSEPTDAKPRLATNVIRTEGPEAVTGRPAMRSSNLGVAKSFSQYDYTKFLAEAIEYVTTFFEGSLSELTVRNPQLQSTFRRPDNDGFEAGLFENGKRIASCGVWLGSGAFGGDLHYSTSGLGQRNSYNESLTTADDGFILGFRTLTSGQSAETRKLLSLEGAAEHLWSLFIAPLQQPKR